MRGSFIQRFTLWHLWIFHYDNAAAHTLLSVFDKDNNNIDITNVICI